MTKPLHAGKSLIRRAAGALGYEFARKQMLPDVEPGFVAMYEICKPYTATSVERMYALYKAVEYIVARRISGDIVECGVWKGGSSMLCALALNKLQKTDISLYLYDTYAGGMPPPTSRDLAYDGTQADAEYWKGQWDSKDVRDAASFEAVQRNMQSTGYPADKIRLIPGRIEETIPITAPPNIAILRLDTDWYDSTYHELLHLYPRLTIHGVLIIDDYGHWKGSREATEQYFQSTGVKPLLHRIDYTGRMCIKTSPESVAT